MLLIALFVLGMILSIFGIYLVVAYSKKIWPFKPTLQEMKKQQALRAAGVPDAPPVSSGWITVILVIFILIFIIFAVFGLYLTVMRYKLVGQALEKGDTGTALALSSPEIGSGINKALSSLYGRY